ncbi:MAG: hypothetical protein NZ108_05035 [Bacteroidia bacterium]|nr:hypothetical protein [Bacteroidia bacterium]
MSWLCLVCETENPNSATICEVCRVERLYTHSEFHKEKRSSSSAIEKDFISFLQNVIEIAHQQQSALQQLQILLNDLLTKSTYENLGIKKSATSSLFGKIFDVTEKTEYFLNPTKVEELQKKIMQIQLYLNEWNQLPVDQLETKLQSFLSKEKKHTDEIKRWYYFWWHGLPNLWKQVLCQSAKVDSFTIETIHKLIQLKTVYSKNIQLETLEPLRSLTSVTKLSVEKAGINNLEPIQELKNLQKVNLSWNPVFDLTPIQSLENLQELNLKRTLVYDISPLKNLKKLQKLSLFGTSVSDLEALLSLPLVSIDLRQTKHLTIVQKLQFEYKLPKCKVLK